MPPLHNLSRSAIVALSLLVWFAPSSLLLFQLANHNVPAVQMVYIWPIMYGLTVTTWFRGIMSQHGWFDYTLAAIISVAMPVGLVVLILRASRWRAIILAIGLIVSFGLAAVSSFWLFQG